MKGLEALTLGPKASSAIGAEASRREESARRVLAHPKPRLLYMAVVARGRKAIARFSTRPTAPRALAA
jgi:hypothetical protein